MSLFPPFRLGLAPRIMVPPFYFLTPLLDGSDLARGLHTNTRGPAPLDHLANSMLPGMIGRYFPNLYRAVVAMLEDPSSHPSPWYRVVAAMQDGPSSPPPSPGDLTPPSRTINSKRRKLRRGYLEPSFSTLPNNIGRANIHLQREQSGTTPRPLRMGHCLSESPRWQVDQLEQDAYYDCTMGMRTVYNQTRHHLFGLGEIERERRGFRRVMTSLRHQKNGGQPRVNLHHLLYQDLWGEVENVVVDNFRTVGWPWDEARNMRSSVRNRRDQYQALRQLPSDDMPITILS
uniref:Uncharacterized protein n=1 Tax=Branchiostoma floridae TaxID=7739 RepID=C3ZUK5_BRAFL|eukprot:XP_002587706.1 hypothetical protein BRAFLDRAFT_94609 [Branchiostoma floridae]